MKNTRIKKTNSIYSRIINISLFILTSIVLFSFSSCARKASFQNSIVVPAARGSVKITKDKNKNYSIDIHLIDLAEPERLQPSKHIYIVWMVTDDNITKNIGQINSSSSLLSKTLKSSFKSVSAFKPVKVFITAEDVADIQHPDGQVVISTDNF